MVVSRSAILFGAILLFSFMSFASAEVPMCTAATNCVDSDGGLVVTVWGQAVQTNPDATIGDSCASSTKVNEAYCKTQVVDGQTVKVAASTVLTCRYTCDEGVCQPDFSKTCVDEDAGASKPQEVSSAVTITKDDGTTTTHHDYCSSSTTLKEATCDYYNDVSFVTINCVNGCSAGACKKPAVCDNDPSAPECGDETGTMEPTPTPEPEEEVLYCQVPI